MRLALAAALLLAAGFAVGYLAALPMVARRVRRAGGSWLRPACAACPEAG